MHFILWFVSCLVLLKVVNALTCFWCKSKVCLVGKTAIITGGAAGIGFQTALALASKGCRVIIADISNLTKAVDELKNVSKNQNIIGVEVDLASFRSVREFAKKILDTEPRLDILVCNAGIGEHKMRIMTGDGVEKTMQINYYSHFLMIHLLLDLLKKSAPSRIAITSSVLAYVSDLTVKELNPSPDYFEERKGWRTFNCGTYSASKLCLAGLTKTLASKLQGTEVIVNVCHPNGVRTSIYAPVVRQAIGLSYFVSSLYCLVCLFGKTPEEGAQTLIHLAHSEEVKLINGRSFYEGMVVHPPFQLTDYFCEQLWKASIEYTKLTPEEIKC
ncbi:retinol dehydrogenase 14 [Dendroctonus ponderosae]|uniref:Uncharacterized protein n=1 Tax=Dendroctonus ponderosae TaxID=77166 RepID=J3JZ27_DENPD|nr:retinol dehydrogenase 14 [Dendroctonus ponderosae]AEE63465.1 unknown [Dendroctonus ponderosae]ERL89367.1 hypothetical protein D910_06738 [Dendroctonus ponderosae]KAH1027875.1 hypothetical protein HUJ05_001306 [Dendroctonus ponderosae]